MAIELQAGHSTPIRAPGGEPLRRVLFGVGWDPVRRFGLWGLLGLPGRADLDAACTVIDVDGRLVDQIDPGHVQSHDTSIVHSGDNPSGEGEGDDEQIYVDLWRMHHTRYSLVFTVTSVTGKRFERIANPFARLVDKESETELVRYRLALEPRCVSYVVATLRCGDDGWEMTAHGAGLQAPPTIEVLSAYR